MAGCKDDALRFGAERSASTKDRIAPRICVDLFSHSFASASDGRDEDKEGDNDGDGIVELLLPSSASVRSLQFAATPPTKWKWGVGALCRGLQCIKHTLYIFVLTSTQNNFMLR